MNGKMKMPVIAIVLMAVTACAIFLCSVSTVAAATNPFEEIPASHWTYDALVQLASRGVISGYPDGIPNEKPLTRYEAASIIARSLAYVDADKVGRQDIEMLRRLVIEFSDELSALGVTNAHLDARLGELDSDIGGWRLSGGAAYSYSGVAADTARYGRYEDNSFKKAAADPVATFGLDVATTSYANVRRFLNEGRFPPEDAVRVEEMINYFPASKLDLAPSGLENSPFSVAYELAPCPWNEKNLILWLSLTANEIDYSAAPPANLVFLVDVSGSMAPPDRLPLVQSALKMLVARLRPADRISLVTYAGGTLVALESTQGSEREKITAAIDALGAGGSTAGASGIALAYEHARRGYIQGGINRILLCTDGDFNVGVSNQDALKAVIERERDSGITLSVFGVGGYNLNDAMMTAISSAGNGNYSYLDGMSEARKVLDEEMASTLVTVAKDVKAQIEFNPANVAEYRQIGYEKRQLKNEDFDDDTVDAGDIGSGRRVVILYELVPRGAVSDDEALRYQSANVKPEEIAYLKLRFKEPDGLKSVKAEMPVLQDKLAKNFGDAGTGLRFSASVAAYGQKLRKNPSMSDTAWDTIASWADASRGDDPYRAEFLQLVKLAGSIKEEGK